MHNEDAAFLASIIGPAGGSADPYWRFVIRQNRALLAFRDEKCALQYALALYQPQRPAAKLTKAFLHAGAPFGAARLLPSQSFSERPGHPIETISRQHTVSIPAILLGNPTQPQRRSLLLAEAPNGERSVFKLATHLLALQATRRESAFLARWGAAIPGIPPLLAESHAETWHAFSIPFLSGPAADAGSAAEIAQLLEKWLLPAAHRPASSFPEWRQLAEIAPPLTGLGKTLHLRPSITHGDLAPWNLINDQKENLMAIDWENGASDGIPAWDIVHFFHQIGSLVKRLAPESLLEWLHHTLASESITNLLHSTGWNERRGALIASYIAKQVAAGEAELPLLEAALTQIESSIEIIPRSSAKLPSAVPQ